MIKQFFKEVNLKKHLFAYLFILIFFSLMYALAFSMIYTLCSMSASILPLLIGNYILYIAAAYVMSRVHFSMMMILRQEEKTFKRFSLFPKILLIYSLFYLLLGVLEFILQSNSNIIYRIGIILIQVISIIYMPLQVYISKYLFEGHSILKILLYSLKAIKQHYMDIFYIGIVIALFIAGSKYFISQDLLFLNELGNFVIFYNPYLGIYDLFAISMIQVVVLFILGILIISLYIFYSMYLMWKDQQ